MPWKWYDSTVVRIENTTPTTKRFWLEVPGEERLDFRAGQFVTMDLPISEKRLKRWRSYSIASAPNGSNVLEFIIVRLGEGAGTKYLFDEVDVGSTIRFKGPDGGFVLPEAIDKDLVLVCTGTGVAPFHSMLLDLHKHDKPHRDIHLIFGCRYARDILYREDFEELQRTMPGFRYSVTLSREPDPRPEDFAFPVYSGYVHQVYQKEHADVRPDVRFYLCGWSPMIDEAVAKLIMEMGYDKSQVVYELYG